METSNQIITYETASPDSYWVCRCCGEMYQKHELGISAICPKCRETKTVIVSRHKGLVEWLAAQGIVGEVIDHISNPQQIKGKIVYGTLPLGLAAETLITYAVEMPRLTKEMRGKDLSMEEMIKAGARLQGFKVRRVD